MPTIRQNSEAADRQKHPQTHLAVTALYRTTNFTSIHNSQGVSAGLATPQKHSWFGIAKIKSAHKNKNIYLIRQLKLEIRWKLCAYHSPYNPLLHKQYTLSMLTIYPYKQYSNLQSK